MPLYGPRRKEYQQRRYAQWRGDVVKLLGGQCVICSATDGLEVHHKNPIEKEFKITQIWSHRWEKQLRELKKCELRCTLHHREFHATELLHGTRAGYKRGCRCAACVEAKRKYMREWKQSRRWMLSSAGRAAHS